MKLVKRLDLSFIPEKFTNVEFVQHPDFFICYRIPEKNIVHLTAFKWMEMPRGWAMRLNWIPP
jgi:hypothetical protein